MRGSIPAWAGETHSRAALYRASAVYPRVGGGNVGISQESLGGDGLSPRGRGKRRSFNQRPTTWGSIPAWAGETEKDLTALYLCVVYPRVGGGNYIAAIACGLALGLSPRGRGKLGLGISERQDNGSIPAWAGETSGNGGGGGFRAVYPRVGGGNDIDIDELTDALGLSPRGRGKLMPIHVYLDYHRSIPAWAGETQLGA